ncbi:MAG: CheR family methyltransferase [Pseudomonadota bacterium]
MTNRNNTSSVPKNDKDLVISDLEFPLVGIGASAGGLSALIRFFEHMPASNGMTFIVILHLSPKHESNADQLIQRATKMPVTMVTSTTPIEKEHVYIIAPNSQLLMNDGYLCIEPLDRPVGQHVAIDVFFRALANVHQERAIAIVMSGTGADGAVGIATVKEQGGITLAQLPEDAEYDGMPRAAINTGFTDFVLPAVEMPQKLIDLWRSARNIELPPLNDGETIKVEITNPASREAAEEALQQIIVNLCVHTGHDFRHYKRATVLRRIERRMQVKSVTTLPAYHTLLESDPAEYFNLLKDMLIGVTNFFRDREAFEALERDVIPEFFKDRDPEEQIRAWVPACSTGEEAYSIAMLLIDQAAQLYNTPSIQIFASDIDEHAINMARKGIYPSSIVTDVPPPRLRQFFTKQEDNFLIQKFVRDKILFASHNLLRDPPFSKIDLISCRNLLIYLNRSVQAQVLEIFHFALKPNGILFLGNSESADSISELFIPIDKKNRIYRAKPSNRTVNVVTARAEKISPRLPNIKKSEREPLSYAQIHQLALMHYGPVSLLVDSDLNIVHMSDRASRFLRFNAGEPSRNLLALVLPELRLELRTVLFQAQQNIVMTEKRYVLLTRDAEEYEVTICVHRFRDGSIDTDLLLVVFSEELKPAIETVSQRLSNDAVLHQLEAELQRNKEQLQETVEHAEISTEELRATNEELQAINEELRSATEELETSKEELQSVNEELVTVNYELKVKVEETSKANDDLNNLIASTDIATIFVDRALRIKRFTPRATEIFSIIPSDIGRSLTDLSHVLEYDNLVTDAAATFETLRPVEREVRRHDGNYYIVRLLPYRTTDDKIDGAVMTFFDITRRRAAEERVRIGEERMRLVAESTKDYAIITLDTDGRVTSWNKGAERIFGFTEAEIIGQPADVIFVPEDRASGVPQDEMRRALKDGRAEDERWHMRKDGSKFYCSGVMTPLTNGTLYGYAKIARDQTARVEMESQREAALNEEQLGRWNAETSSALKDQFLAIMSHELRHPLNLIHINVELLSRLNSVIESPLGQKATSVIRSSVQSQAKIIEDLLDMSRLNTGKLTINKSPVDLAGLINSIVEVFQSDTAANDIRITMEGTNEPLVVMADSVRVEQVILNLLSNALKFTPSGGSIMIRLGNENSEARVDVIDTGQGIAAEVISTIFDMFSQAGSATSRSKSGLGIGLALVRQIAELHNGRVNATSAGRGQGTCFSVWLPIGSDNDNEKVSVSQLGQKITGLRILIVDDSEDMISAFKTLLEMEGAEVLIACSAKEGIEIVKREKIDLLISDISMPEMNGYEFIKKVRQLPTGAKLPAIALSGLSREQDIAQCFKAGFSAHFNKPLSLERLIGTIVKLINHPRGGLEGSSLQ